jgi:hypothetical protein
MRKRTELMFQVVSLSFTGIGNRSSADAAYKCGASALLPISDD